jgi:glutamyl-Q tRNA(Asp) synthetase
VSYVGRFAPSPTGDLHAGTLCAAVASFLHARQAQGRWLVRIEDIDPPREVQGSASRILRTLEQLDLEWDGEVIYQSERLEAYREAADRLLTRGLAYYCRCSRAQIRQLTGGRRYPGTCRNRALGSGDAAVRLRVKPGNTTFRDRIQGELEYDVDATDGDFVIFRRDGLPAYHLAVVVDDAWQAVTDVVRGADLLSSTPLHIQLQTALGLASPRYSHIPVITSATGEKLSKSAGAAALNLRNAGFEATRALKTLGLTLPDDLRGARPATQWQWAIRNFSPENLSLRAEMAVSGS